MAHSLPPVVGPTRRERVAAKHVLESAERLQFVVAPPDEWTPEQPMFGFVPPAPPPELMRAGLLAHARQILTDADAERKTEGGGEDIEGGAAAKRPKVEGASGS